MSGSYAIKLVYASTLTFLLTGCGSGFEMNPNITEQIEKSRRQRQATATPTPTPTGVATPTPSPTPTPPPTNTTLPSSESPIVNIGGSVVPVSAVEALGGVFTKYEQNFRTYIEKHWVASGADWEAGNYYDRAKIYYVWYERTGNTTYLNRANAIAIDYRTRYLEANNYGASAHWAMMAGLAMHYRMTSDPKSQRALGALADSFALPYYLANLGKVDGEMDNRIQARTLTSFLYAWQVGAPSIGVPNIQPDGSDWGAPGGNHWPTLLRDALNKILSSQSADGAYRWKYQCGYNKPFMVGLLNDALIEYYEKFEKDPRILPAIKKSLDYMWANNWVSSAGHFVYLEADCPLTGETSAGNADLNNLMLPGFGFVYKHTGDVAYRTRGDAVLTGGVNGAWLDGSKHFNQSYTNSYKYLFYRQ